MCSSDLGVLAVMDSRLLSRPYGRIFLESLPPYPLVHDLEPIRDYPVGTVFADPVENALRFGLALVDLLIYRFRIGFLGKEPIDPSNPAMSLRELIQAVRQTHFSGRRRIISLYTRYFFQDPVVSLVWWIQFIVRRWIWNLPKELGR